ncbi:MAG: ammonium transporter [Acidobacteriota bacterium]
MDVVGGMELTINTVWLMTATTLIFFMQLGFAFLEGGSVRSKNTVNVVMKNFVDMCFGALFFWFVGYGLMFGTNPTGWFGTDHFILSSGVDWDFSLLLFQMMFAATAATIVSGAMAERIRFWPYLVISVLVTIGVYSVFGSWVWGSYYGETQGWLRKLGFIDFAGATVVHSIGGWCAMAGILVLGPRLGRFAQDGTARTIPGHNLPLVAAGGFILWVGWFGFNGGSALEAGANLGRILLNTHLSGSAGVVGAILLMGLLRRPVLMTTTVNGGLAGLVASTGGCATMSAPFAVLTGLVAGAILVLGLAVFDGLGLDDPVGAVSVHAFNGVWGTVAAGLFVSGDLFNLEQVTVQLIGVVAAFLWAFPISWVIFRGVDLLIPLRASTMHEQRGLDFTEHYEMGYPEFQQDILHGGKEDV